LKKKEESEGEGTTGQIWKREKFFEIKKKESNSRDWNPKH